MKILLEVPVQNSLSLRSPTTMAFRNQVMVGAGIPVALQTSSALVPSRTSSTPPVPSFVSRGGTVGEHEAHFVIRAYEAT